MGANAHMGDSIMDMQDGYEADEGEDTEAEGGSMWDAMVSQLICG